jgi:DNA polymerase-3 subunit beta
MKFTIEKEIIVNSLKLAANVADRKASMPILSFVKLSAARPEEETHKLAICASDLEMGFQVNLAAEIQEPGEICLPAKILHDVISNLPDGPVEFIVDAKHAMSIRAASGFYSILGRAPDDFPVFPDLTDINPMVIKASDLRSLISKVLYAVSTDPSRININGGYLRQDDPPFIMVATDGHRMAKAVLNLDGETSKNCGLDAGVIIPRAGLREILHILDKSLDKMASIGSIRNFFLLRIPEDNITFHVQLIEAEFPDYNRVLPKGLAAPVALRRTALLESLQRIGVLAGCHNVLELSLSGSSLRLSVNDPDTGAAEETLEVRNLSGEEGEKKVDIRYLKQAVEVTSEDEIIIDLPTGSGPLQVMNYVSREDSEKDYLGILMPLKL